MLIAETAHAAYLRQRELSYSRERCKQPTLTFPTAELLAELNRRQFQVHSVTARHAEARATVCNSRETSKTF
jgi:hypothetical protein